MKPHLLAAIILASVNAACLQINVTAPQATPTPTPTETPAQRVATLSEDEIDAILREAGWPESVIAERSAEDQECPTVAQVAYIEQVGLISVEVGLTMVGFSQLGPASTESDVRKLLSDLEGQVEQMEAANAPASLHDLHQQWLALAMLVSEFIDTTRGALDNISNPAYVASAEQVIESLGSRIDAQAAKLAAGLLSICG